MSASSLLNAPRSVSLALRCIKNAPLPIHSGEPKWIPIGILNLLSIVYALRPRLRSRLTLGGRTFPRKPWVYGGQEFNLSYRYSCLHPHFLTLHVRFPLRFDALRTLPYQSILANQNGFRSEY